MRLLTRLKNLWKLSEYEPGQPNEEYKTPGTRISMIVRKPEKAIFIPRVKENPIDKVAKLGEETI